jgi:hypothetical protein
MRKMSGAYGLDYVPMSGSIAVLFTYQLGLMLDYGTCASISYARHTEIAAKKKPCGHAHDEAQPVEWKMELFKRMERITGFMSFCSDAVHL